MSGSAKFARTASRAAAFICVAVFLYVFLVNAWIGDDPFITFRTVDNFVHGYGLVWNTDERVQAYTHPLWMFLISGIYLFTHEAYYSTIILCLVSSLAALMVCFSTIATTWWQRCLLTLVLITSKAWVDYASSGLENPLSYLLLACFFAPILRDRSAPSGRRFAYYLVVAALAFTNRADTSLLYAPAIVALVIARARATGFWKTFGLGIVCMAPAWGWLVFATLYYGFPFPNTAYSKLSAGGPAMPLIHPNGPRYFLNSFRWDPLTLVVIVAGAALVAVAWVRRVEDRRAVTLLFAGAATYLAYTLRIGGDYMSGRFFSLPFFAVAMLVVLYAHRAASWFFFAAFSASTLLFAPRPPLLVRATTYEPLPLDPTGVLDESGRYHDINGLMTVIKHAPSPGRSSTPVCRRFRETNPCTMVWGAIGYFGFAVGPRVHVVDPIGLPDPLIARLPPDDPLTGWGRGHLFHDIPAGYTASIETGQDLIADPDLNVYYEKLRILTRGPIFTRSRIREIYRMNTGAYDGLVAAYARRAKEHLP